MEGKQLGNDHRTREQIGCEFPFILDNIDPCIHFNWIHADLDYILRPPGNRIYKYHQL